MDTVVPKKHPGTPPTSQTSPDDNGPIGAGPMGPIYTMALTTVVVRDLATTKQQPRKIPWEGTPEETICI